MTENTLTHPSLVVRFEGTLKHGTSTVMRSHFGVRNPGRGTITLSTHTRAATTCCHASCGAPQSSTPAEWRTRAVLAADARPASGRCSHRAGWGHSAGWARCSPAAAVAGAQRCWSGTTAALTVCWGPPRSPAVRQTRPRMDLPFLYFFGCYFARRSKSKCSSD